MCSPFRLAVLLPAALFYSSLSLADSAVSMQQQLEALSARVHELERRLDALESPEVKRLVRQASAPENPGDGQDRSNWDRLKVGYDYIEVRELLGEPLQVKKGGMEFWYYSERGLKGPYVKFLFRKVNDWQPPETGRGTPDE